MRETAPTSARPASLGRLGLAVFLVLAILVGVGIWSGWLRPYAGRHLGGFDVGLRIHYRRCSATCGSSECCVVEHSDGLGERETAER